MLNVINLILIVIIIGALTIIFYMLLKFRNQVKEHLTKLSVDVSQSSEIARQALLRASGPTNEGVKQVQSRTYTPQSISFADLAEFDRVNPTAKQLYKKYVVGNVMPRVINKINNESLTPNAIKAFDQVGQVIVNMTDDQLFANAMKNSPFVAQPSPVASSPQKATPSANVSYKK
jgi:hypothetical protein